MSAALDKLMDDLDKTVGANSARAEVTKFIDTGFPDLNHAISGRYNGGLPFGRMGEVFGESSTGKTALATKWMIEAQRMGGVAIFVDWERSFDQGVAHAMGLNIDRPFWLYFKPDTWEAGNTLAMKAVKVIRESKVIPADAPILIVLDSIAAATPNSKIGKELDELNMNDTTALARATSGTLPTMAMLAEKYDATFVYLNQMRLKPGVMFGDPRTTPGGKSMEYYSTFRLALGRSKISEQVEGEKKFIGQQINAECVKSKLTAPFKKTQMRMVFNEMDVMVFDVAFTMIENAIELGLLEYNKPHVTWTDGKKYHVKSLAKKIVEDDEVAVLRAMFKDEPR